MRHGNELWLMTHGGNPSRGYTIYYSTARGEIARWIHPLMEDLVSTPLPANLRLMYTAWDDNVDNLREFTRDQVRSLSLHEDDIYYAKDFYDIGLEDIPGGTLADSPADSPADRAPPPPPPPYAGPNWQEVPTDDVSTDKRVSSISDTQEIQYNAECPFCQHKFAVGQSIQKYRCGHAACTDCYDDAMRRGWLSCTICRKSSTTHITVLLMTVTCRSSSVRRPPLSATSSAPSRSAAPRWKRTKKQSWIWSDS